MGCWGGWFGWLGVGEEWGGWLGVGEVWGRMGRVAGCWVRRGEDEIITKKQILNPFVWCSGFVGSERATGVYFQFYFC